MDRNSKFYLTVRPWISGFNQRYGHIDTIMNYDDFKNGCPARRYGDLEVVGDYDDPSRTVRYEALRFTCQYGGVSQPVGYGHKVGYNPSGRSFGMEELRRYGDSIRKIDAGLRKIKQLEGYSDSAGLWVARLARVVKADGIAVVERADLHAQEFRSDESIQLYGPKRYCDAIHHGERIEQELLDRVDRKAA